MRAEQFQRLNKEEQLNLIRAISKDYALFAKVVMGHIVTDMPDYQKEVYSILNAQERRDYNFAAFIMSRGLAKSTISKTIQTTADAMFAREPFVLMLSESVGQATKDLGGVQDELEHNEMVNLISGNLKGVLSRDGGRVWNREECELTNGVFLSAKGYGSRVRGIKWKTQRPTKIILDDFESEANTGTKKQRDAVEEWVDAQVLPAGEPRTVFQFWGTIVHPESYLAGLKDLKYFNKPRGVYYKKDIEHNGVPAWPSRFPMSWIKDKREFFADKNRLAFFLQEYYNIPMISSNVIFDMDAIITLDATVEKYEHLTYLKAGTKKIPMNIFIGVDPARSLNSGADDTAYCAIGMLPGRKVVLLELKTEKTRPNQQVKNIFKLAEKYSPRHIEIEINAYQYSLVDWCRTRMNEGWQPAFAIREYTSRSGKSKKYIEGLEPFINSGATSRLRSMEGWQKLKYDAEHYDSGRRDNQDNSLDAFFLALDKAFPPQMYDVDEAIAELKRSKNNTTKSTRSWITI